MAKEPMNTLVLWMTALLLVGLSLMWWTGCAPPSTRTSTTTTTVAETVATTTTLATTTYTQRCRMPFGEYEISFPCRNEGTLAKAKPARKSKSP